MFDQDIGGVRREAGMKVKEVSSICDWKET